MERCTRLLQHPLYKEYTGRTIDAERGRIFCRHDMAHFLDTARIGYILILENGLPIEKELMYACALLHDAARCEQDGGLTHEETGARLAQRLMPECGFSDDETRTAAEAIRAHRSPPKDAGAPKTLSDVLYAADKLSRRCFDCAAYDECNWQESRKNTSIIY